jgi:Spy/CpxP family protein refolding chaperone
MKKTCCLLMLSFCAIATSIYSTKSNGRPCRHAVSLVPPRFPCDYSCQLSSRLAPLLPAENPLDLSVEQIADVSCLVENQQTAVQPLLRKIVAARKRIHQITASRNFDESSLRPLMEEVNSLQAETLVEIERFDAKIYSVFSRKQQQLAEELLQSVEVLHSGENNTPHLAAVVTERMNNLLSLTDQQAARVAEIIDKSRREISPHIRETTEIMYSLSHFRHFNEAQARHRATRQAEKMSVILLASERVTAKIFALLGEKQRDTAENVAGELESCVRTRILSLQNSGSAANLKPINTTSGDSRSFGTSCPKQVLLL